MILGALSEWYIPIQSIIYFGDTFFLGQTHLKPINDRIDNKMAIFPKVCPKVES